MNARPPSARGGFTLIEMIITLSVFLLLAGAIFSIFGATLQSADTLQDDQNREDQSEALGAWLRQSFLALPAQGTLVSYHRNDRPFRVSGIIWGTADNLHALDLQAQANGHYLLRLAVANEVADGTGPAQTAGYPAALAKFQTQVFDDDPALSWRVLVRDLQSADWRFRVANSTDWSDVATSGKPLLAELTFQPAAAAGAIVDDFWIPPVQPAGLPALVAPPVAAPGS
jgi:prepilin-type N-terminal cleavage/methylation domain-containing protein